MTRYLWWSLGPLLLAAMLAGCSRQEPVHDYQSFVFGTLVDVKIRSHDKRTADQASALLFSEFDRLHKAWHAWQPGELVQTSEKLKSGQWFRPPADILPLLIASQQYYRDSDGLFNPAIGQLIALWGFHADELPRKPPTKQQIEGLLAVLPGMDDIEIDAVNGRIRGHNPHLDLDLGGMAKGTAVARGMALLRHQGVTNALINAGGDLCGIGDRGDRDWRIGIRNPRGAGVLASIELADGECVFTSGDYERGFDYQGKYYHHIIDPRTGYPADKAISATVIHTSAALADAASTALLIAGPDDWARIARSMGVDEVMIVDHAGRLYMTPSMQQRLQLENGDRYKITITRLKP